MKQKEGFGEWAKLRQNACKDNSPSVSLDMGVNSAKDCWHLGKDTCLRH